MSEETCKEWSLRGAPWSMTFHLGVFGHSDSVFLSSLKSVLTSGQLYPVLMFTLFLINLFHFGGKGGSSLTRSLQFIFPVK